MVNEERPKRLYESGINDKYGLGFLPFIALVGCGFYVNNLEGNEYAQKAEQIAREREVVRELKTSIEGVLEEKGLEGYTVNISGGERKWRGGVNLIALGVGGTLVYCSYFFSKKLSKTAWEARDREKEAEKAKA